MTADWQGYVVTTECSSRQQDEPVQTQSLQNCILQIVFDRCRAKQINKKNKNMGKVKASHRAVTWTGGKPGVNLQLTQT